MNFRPESGRYERKYPVPPQWTSPELLIKLHPAGFREVFPPRTINSLYFDDQERTNWQESEAGCFERRKYRIRWYGELQGDITPVLEIKSKRGYLGWKQKFRISKFTWEGFFPEHLFCMWKNKEIPPRVRAALGVLEPVLLVGYRRRYFLSADGRYRVTQDSDISFFPVHGPRTKISHGRTDPNPTVLELKYAAEEDKGADAIAQYWPFRMARKSKYATGMEITTSHALPFTVFTKRIRDRLAVQSRRSIPVPAAPPFG